MKDLNKAFNLLRPSEEVTKTWIKGQDILISHRPKPSKFSFTVCLAIVCSIAFGFLAGFFTAGFALDENYSTVYENLLTELETTKRCLEREKNNLDVTSDHVPSPTVLIQHAHYNHGKDNFNNHVQEQAVFSVFSHAVELLQKNDKAGACQELYNITSLSSYRGKWKHKADHLINKNCRR